VLTEFEGNEFVMDTLYPGTVCHVNSYLLEDYIHLPLRCKVDSKLLILEKSLL